MIVELNNQLPLSLVNWDDVFDSRVFGIENWLGIIVLELKGS